MQQPEVIAASESSALAEFRFAARAVLGSFKIPEPGNVVLLNVKRVFDARAQHMSLCAEKDVKGPGLMSEENLNELSLLESLAKIAERPIEKLIQFHKAGRLSVQARVIRAHREGTQVFLHVCLESLNGKRGWFDGEQLIVPAWCFGEVPAAPGASAPATVN